MGDQKDRGKLRWGERNRTYPSLSNSKYILCGLSALEVAFGARGYHELNQAADGGEWQLYVLYLR